MNKKLLIIANVTNTHTHRFVREFKKRKWRVYILSIQPPNKRNIEEFGEYVIQLPTYWIYRILIHIPFLKYSEFHNINSGVSLHEPYSISSIFNYLYLLLFIKKIVKRIDPTAIFSIYLTMNGFLAALSGHKRIISSAAGADVAEHKPYSLYYWVNHPAILRMATRRAYKVLGFDRESFEPVFKKKKCGVENILWMEHWGVETDAFAPPKKRTPSNGRTCRFVCSRPYRPQFDFESILLALKNIHEENKNIKFIIASGAQSEKNLDHLMKVFRKTGCTALGFTSVLGHIDYGDLPELLRHCDVYIDPINVHKYPETEGWGVSGSLLEAMSCELIPVISRRPSTDWILPSEARPFIYEDFETGLVTALKNALNSRTDEHIRTAMREAVLKKANWHKNLDGIERLFLQ